MHIKYIIFRLKFDQKMCEMYTLKAYIAGY